MLCYIMLCYVMLYYVVLLPTRVGFIPPPTHYLVCEFRAKNFLQHFHVISMGLIQYFPRGLHAAVRSIIGIDNSRGTPDRIWHQGCVGGVSSDQFHNRLDAQQRHVVSLPEGKRGESLNLWGSDKWASEKVVGI